MDIIRYNARNYYYYYYRLTPKWAEPQNKFIIIKKIDSRRKRRVIIEIKRKFREEKNRPL